MYSLAEAYMAESVAEEQLDSSFLQARRVTGTFSYPGSFHCGDTGETLCFEAVLWGGLIAAASSKLEVDLCA